MKAPNSIGVVESEHAEAFAMICEHAVKLLETAEVHWLPATGEYLAEVPGHRLEFWAIGADDKAARAELLKVTTAKLQQILAGKNPRCLKEEA